MSNGTIIVPPPAPPNTGQYVNCPPYPGPGLPFPIQPTERYGGYPPQNPTAAWNYIPPPTGCVYGLDGSTASWVPVVTRWEVMCMLQQATEGVVPEAPKDGQDYVRNGLDAEWIAVNSLVLDGGTF